jgi:uroporphyrinogen-III synthase
VIRIAPTNEPAPAEPCDALIVTSAHAVEALPSTMDRQQPVFAVGERTAQALRQAGFTSVTAADGDAVSLSGLIRQRLETGRTLLHVTARHRKAEPAASLREAGYRVLSWEAYEARALSHLSSAAIDACRTGKIHAALHYSRRSADLFIERAGEAGLTSSLRNFPHLCLSADVAAPLKAIGASTLVAQEPFEDALLSLLGGLP